MRGSFVILPEPDLEAGEAETAADRAKLSMLRGYPDALTEHAMSLDRFYVTQPAAEPFLTLLYRYIWPFAYFRDVTRGKRLERQLNYRYNRQMRVYLPGFAAKWACLTALFFGIGFGLASQAAPELLTACLFATGVSALTVSVVVMTAWCWLTRFPELY